MKKEKKKISASLLNPYTARNVDDIQSFIKETIDGRKLITISNIRHYHDINCGEMIRNGARNQFTLPAYRTLTKLVGALTIHNSIICTKDELASILGCSTTLIKRTLKPCGSLVRYSGSDGMQKGFVKLFINPAYGWKGEHNSAYSSQQSAISNWYSSEADFSGDVIVSMVGKPYEISEDFNKWLTSFAKSIRPLKDTVYEDQAESYFFKGV